MVDVPHEQATLLLSLHQLVARRDEVLLQRIPRDTIALPLLVGEQSLLNAVWHEGGFATLVLA